MSMNRPIFEVQLEKRSRGKGLSQFKTSWKQRTIVLSGQVLDYCADDELKGSFFLADSNVYVVLPSEADQRLHAFAIDNGSVVLLFNAASDVIRDRTMEIFRRAAQNPNWEFPPDDEFFQGRGRQPQKNTNQLKNGTVTKQRASITGNPIFLQQQQQQQQQQNQQTSPASKLSLSPMIPPPAGIYSQSWERDRKAIWFLWDDAYTLGMKEKLGILTLDLEYTIRFELCVEATENIPQLDLLRIAPLPIVQSSSFALPFRLLQFKSPGSTLSKATSFELQVVIFQVVSQETEIITLTSLQYGNNEEKWNHIECTIQLTGTSIRVNNSEQYQENFPSHLEEMDLMQETIKRPGMDSEVILGDSLTASSSFKMRNLSILNRSNIKKSVPNGDK
jgi:hypothetical protein